MAEQTQTLIKSHLTDAFGRQVTYLRLSVTDRCNLRCTYCMAEDMTFLPKKEILSFEEIQRIAQIFVSLGVTKIRLTGGEPTIRKGLVELCSHLSKINGLQELSMTSNGLLLNKFAQPLQQAGINRMNISIDSLRPERFKKLTRTGYVSQVIQGILAAKEAGFDRVKLNAVILKEVNDDEVISITQFALDHEIDISFIEEMPLGHIDSHTRSDTQFCSQSIVEQLQTKWSLSALSVTTGGPSKYQQIEHYPNTRIGFISPLSDNFCNSCNRVRLTAEGRLVLCLGHEHSLDLRHLIRNQKCTDHELTQHIVNSMANKPEKHHFDPNDTQILRFMSATGG